MALDENALRSTYNLVNLSVSSSTQISTRTAAVARHLRDECKTTIVALTAASRAATKSISIAEIAKRDFDANGEKIFQYNALACKMLEMPRKPRRKLGEHADESDDAFEVVRENDQDAMIKRKLPVLTIYLARTPVKELSTAYGEQT
ncbi:hypothetical protein AC579_2914 [Pseudocercospora musae]|uniref:DNA/RNA-binding protein Alba-like domain-containing protein n=1 Tax=Pseudocercospora musae TaxID=113226 RepID=A0A139ITX6_9PEZI|nr:hypothetical protein AC579_2914 [Pseudocercospora musae]